MFTVPPEELKRIPYAPNTLIRLVPHTEMHMLRPSNWFRAGVDDPGYNFTVNRDRHGEWNRMHLTLSEELFFLMLADTFLLRQGMHPFAHRQIL
jgi:hypothetical protein